MGRELSKTGLFYSKKAIKVYCFTCKLFGQSSSQNMWQTADAVIKQIAMSFMNSSASWNK